MIIMPSGNGSCDWLTNSRGLTKTASNNGGEVQEERDELFEAAKKVVANYECADGEFGADDDHVEFKGEVGEVDEVSDEVSVEVDPLECLETAKEAIEEAVECLGGGDESDDFEAEVDIEVEDDEVEEFEVEGGVNCMSESGECDKCHCDPCNCDDHVEAGVTASSDGWVKLAEISPNNRKKIYDYWSKQLGYPKDFVKLMVKDYEK